jgi:hypothetical protein
MKRPTRKITGTNTLVARSEGARNEYIAFQILLKEYLERRRKLAVWMQGLRLTYVYKCFVSIYLLVILWET